MKNWNEGNNDCKYSKIGSWEPTISI